MIGISLLGSIVLWLIDVIRFSHMILAVVLVGLFLLGFLGVFSKAREPAWAVFIPFFDMMVLAKVGGQPPVYGLLTYVPLAGIYWGILILLGVAKKFNKPPWYIVFLLLPPLPLLFWPLLGLGPDEYGKDYRKRKKLLRIKRSFDEEEWDALEEEEARADWARRKLRGEDMEEEEEEEEEGQKPRRRRRPAAEEDEEDERPRRRRRREVEEEDEEEEDQPRRRRREVEEDEDEEPRPRSRRRSRRDEDED